MEFLFTLTLVLAVVFVSRQLFNTTTIYEYEKGLKYSRGKFCGLLGPGLYFFRIDILQDSKG